MWDDVNSKLKTVNEDHHYPFGLQHKGYARETVRENDLVEIGAERAIPRCSTSGSANYKYKYNDYGERSLNKLLTNIAHEVLNYKMN